MLGRAAGILNIEEPAVAGGTSKAAGCHKTSVTSKHKDSMLCFINISKEPGLGMCRSAVLWSATVFLE